MSKFNSQRVLITKKYGYHSLRAALRAANRGARWLKANAGGMAIPPPPRHIETKLRMLREFMDVNKLEEEVG